MKKRNVVSILSVLCMFLISTQAFARSKVCHDKTALQKFKVPSLSEYYVDQLLGADSQWGGSVHVGYTQVFKQHQYKKALKALREGKIVGTADVKRCARLSMKQ